MNTQQDLIKRLLKLFPIKLLKEAFTEEGSATEAIEAISQNNTSAVIQGFVKDNMFNTRQHIYLNELNNNFRNATMNDFPLEIKSSSSVAGEHTYFCLPKITYRVYLSSPLEETEVSFLQPLTIKVKGKKVTIHFTKIEKTITSYFPPERAASKKSKSQHEDETLPLIRQFFEDKFGIKPLDLNRGIKHLWNIDQIDGRKVQARDTASFISETMDEDQLFKRRYPEKYAELATKPLEKTLFVYLPDNDDLCETFECNPSTGEINIPKFPSHSNQVANVVSEILRHN